MAAGPGCAVDGEAGRGGAVEAVRKGGGGVATTGWPLETCGSTDMGFCTGVPARVTPAGATTSTPVGAERTTMPGRTTGGAVTVTEGGVPTGAGTMTPRCEPGGGGTKT